MSFIDIYYVWLRSELIKPSAFFCQINEKVMKDAFSNFKVFLIKLVFCFLDIYIKSG